MNSLKLSIAMYLTVFLTLLILKPNFCFYENNMKHFGIDEHCTLFPIYGVSFIVAVVVYFLSSIIYKN